MLGHHGISEAPISTLRGGVTGAAASLLGAVAVSAVGRLIHYGEVVSTLAATTLVAFETLEPVGMGLSIFRGLWRRGRDLQGTCGTSGD
ncbi:MAG: hypothetical protein HY749_16260 [Gammaproteobacteria bacterium]|nr:hypothetical protein [Gammaproteobacteria bacterium]